MSGHTPEKELEAMSDRQELLSPRAIEIVVARM
jgi:hypothetical protein